MAVGAQDLLDKMLVRKYSNQKMENHTDIANKMIDPEKMMDAMNDAAAMHLTMVAMTGKLNDICSQINAKARYACGQTFYPRSILV